MGENLHVKKKKMIVELVKGKEIATQLQTLLQNPVQDPDRVLIDELALRIWRSFSVPLSMLSNSTNQIEIKKVKDRRGCYKRRKSCDSWTTVSQTTEDGCAWRKYGQKGILNSQYPRCYFRCTHKYEGCKATKQVQRIKENPIVLYQTTYFNHHTCSKETVLLSKLIVDSDPVEPNLLSFKTTVQSKQINDHDHDQTPTLKKDTNEIKDMCGANSSLEDPYWQEIMIGSCESGAYYEPVFSDPLLYQDDDMEVNQLGDIDNLQFDDGIYSTLLSDAGHV